ncbi:T-complex protein 1 subunit zeta [Nematocida sp. AWRm77]|nr:T-complex protein 1 subunit zeta [Nematocida sp. AWRm77]
MYLGKETQVTQTGQAVYLNTDAVSQLANALRNGLGPSGATKMLLTPAGEIRIAKDGITLLSNIQLAQPGALLLSRIVSQQSTECGDGVTSAIIVAASLLSRSLEYITEGVHPQTLIGRILEKEKEVLAALESMKIEVAASERAEWVRSIAQTSLRTKFSLKQAQKFADILVSAVQTVATQESVDLKMLEVMKMPCLESKDPLRIVHGLVMDHGGRHPMMPKKMSNVFILCTNISFEYEKPEHNAQFYYKRTADKQALEEGERRVVLQRVQKVLEAMQEVARAHAQQNPQFMVITQKGIDQYALEVFARHKVLALRRAKRRNMERLQRLTGCTPVGSLAELSRDAFGFAGSVREVQVGEEKYTFVENTPFSTSCTLLIQGISPYQMAYLESSVKSALKSIACGMMDKAVLPGGASVFIKLAEVLAQKNAKEECLGLQLWKDALLAVPKTLSKNLGYNSVETLAKARASSTEYPTVDINTGDIISAPEHSILDNYTVTDNVIRTAALAATKILMIDEIIKSGKEMKGS